MAKLLLSQKLIDNFVSPDGKKQELRDTIDLGLVYEIGAKATAGNGTYQYRCRIDGQQRCVKICRGSEKPLAEVRSLLKAMKADVANGIDPTADAKAQKAILTLDDFFQNHYVPFKRGRKKVGKDEALWRLRIKDRFGHMPLNKLTRLDVQAFLTELHATGLKPSTANHYIRLLRHLYNCAISLEIGIDRNPARIPLIPENNKVEHFLDDEQLSRLMQVLQTYGNRPVSLLAMLLLGTGMRLEEGLGLKWSAVDRENRIIRLEATRTKAKRAHVVPISNMVIAVLDELKTDGRHEYLFVSQKTGQHLRYVHKVWERIRAEADLPWLRIHDLRHNFASTLINSGESLVTVQVLLNHADISTTAKRYIHLSNKTLGSAAETAGAKFAAAMKAAV